MFSLSSLPRRSLIALGALVAFVILCIAWYAARDEALLPGAQELFAQKSKLRDEKNVYYAAIALTAPLDKDPAAVGREMVRVLNEAVDRKGPFVEFDTKPYLEFGFLNIDQKLYCMSPPSMNKTCTDVYQENAALVASEMQRLAPYVARYRALRSAVQDGGGYDEMIRSVPASLLVSVSPAQSMSSLVQADIASRVRDPREAESALSELAEEVMLWRALNRSGATLGTKLSLRIVNGRHLRQITELLTQNPALAVQHKELVERITTPLTFDSASLERTFAAEFRFAARAMSGYVSLLRGDTVDGLNEITHPNLTLTLNRVVFKENAGINFAFRAYQRNTQMLELKPQLLVEERMRALARARERSRFADEVSLMFNPTTGSWQQSSERTFIDTILREHDFVSFSRAIEVQRQIAANRIAPENVNTFIASLGASLHNPITEAPFVFNVATHTITFENPTETEPRHIKRVIKITFTNSTKH
jgi:hypothetical protein